MIARDVVSADFSDRVGKPFAVEAAGGEVELKLEAMQALPGSSREGGAFRLEFVGPAQPLLDQGIFPFTIDGERFDIFIVPYGQDARGTRYEAIYY